MQRVMEVGKEKWIMKYCSKCKRWVKAHPSHWPIVDLMLGEMCLRCTAKQDAKQQQHMSVELTKS